MLLTTPTPSLLVAKQIHIFVGEITLGASIPGFHSTYLGAPVLYTSGTLPYRLESSIIPSTVIVFLCLVLKLCGGQQKFSFPRRSGELRESPMSLCCCRSWFLHFLLLYLIVSSLLHIIDIACHTD